MTAPVPDRSRLTESQEARRRRIVEATMGLAVEGGYDAVQMRAVASRSEVALGTLYRYFPSKEHLLVGAMLQEVEDLADRMATRPPQGETPRERVVDVLARATRALQREPSVTAAMVRSLVSTDGDVAPAVGEIRRHTNGLIIDAIRGVPPGTSVTEDLDAQDPGRDRDLAAADMLEGVWLAALIGWIGKIDTADSVMRKLEEAVDVLLPAP